jgi:hypothetical protein
MRLCRKDSVKVFVQGSRLALGPDESALAASLSLGHGDPLTVTSIQRRAMARLS